MGNPPLALYISQSPPEGKKNQKAVLLFWKGFNSSIEDVNITVWVKDRF
jgi:uncharacterized protein YggU (UPF0235/DUF167 family)